MCVFNVEYGINGTILASLAEFIRGWGAMFLMSQDNFYRASAY